MWKLCSVPARLGTTLLFDLKVFGLENVPKHGGAIIASNHQSYLDPVLLGVRLGRPISYLAKSQLFKNPLFSWLIRSLHAFPVKQGAGDIGAMKESIRRVQEGHLLTVFPEGTRTETGDLQPIQPGVALIVRRAGVPIIPAVIDGAFEAFGPDQKVLRPWPILLSYGPAMKFDGLKGEQITELIDQTFHRMRDDLRAKRAEFERNLWWPKGK